jgi:hypothetical protein
MSKQEYSADKNSFIVRGIVHLLGFPRLLRIVLVGLFALAVTFVVALLLYYQSIFYSPDLQIVFYIIATVFGLFMYLAGWRLIVGTVGETPPVQRSVVWYLGVGLLATLMIVLWVIQMIVTID